MRRSTGEFQLVRPRGNAVGSSLRRLRRRLRSGPPGGSPGGPPGGSAGGSAGGSRRRRSVGPALVILFCAAVLGASVWVILATSVLGVRHVEVTGTGITTVDDVRAAADIRLGTPLARLDTVAVATRIGGLAPVASVEVSRSWPDTVVIEVTERVPVATVRVPGGFQVLDAAGVVFHTVAKRPEGVLLLKVAAPGPADSSTRAALRVLAALTPQLRSTVTAVSATGPSAVRLELSGGRVVIWGDAEESERKAQVATALLGRPGRMIDVSAPDVATTSS